MLEHWSDLNNVFSFVRIEDMAYDKRPGMSNVVYIADSGRGRGPPTARDSTRMATRFRTSRPTVASGRWSSTRAIPRSSTSLSILIEGDDTPTKTLTEVRQPDNLETTRNGLYITEDPGSSQQFAAGDPAGMNARVWQYKFGGGALTPVLEVNQAADGGPTDAHRTPGNMGAWEASGIVDVSSLFGPGIVPDRRSGSHPVHRHGSPAPTLPIRRPATTGPTSGKAASCCW